MSSSVIAVFDIGKTNKKVFLIDEHYKIVYEKSAQFAETTDEDGDACEDIALLTTWMRQSLHEILQLPGFEVKAMNFSTYGASFVHINGAGEVIAPLYNYLKPYPKALQQTFYNTYGGEVAVSAATASPVLGHLNSGMLLYRLKYEHPRLYEAIHYSLHLPQYISYLITGQVYSDITSIGCHTQLWDFSRQQYHTWVQQEGISEKLAPIFPSNEVVQVSLNGRTYPTGIGLHDSSAALIPYLANFSEPFVLISTGTWCITLNPFNQTPLTSAELQQDCLCYLEYHGKPVKASRLFAGNEHEQQTKKLAEYFNVPLDFYKTVEFDPAIVSRLQKAQLINNTSIANTDTNLLFFKSLDPSQFASYEDAYHQLLLNIIVAQKYSTGLVLDNTNVKRIFVDGGFSKNPVFMHLLAAAFPGMEVYAASVAQATAIGAALAIHKHWNHLPLPGDLVALKYYVSAAVTEEEY
ncbi:FGGY-family carbohydrate kinase [Chitinophaga defluvii]|uniref:FGGY family carbohydrate kinase n=1 Tax=Chitinophaga defluvii TaxID=3163343 RepID=A0ABV2T0L6_9BACT